MGYISEEKWIVGDESLGETTFGEHNALLGLLGLLFAHCFQRLNFFLFGRSQKD